jgi:cytochrome c oxidase subunit 2
MVAAGLVLTAVMRAVVLSLPWFPTEASTQVREIHTLWDVLLVASVPVFALVVTIIGTSIIRFRMRPGQEEQDGPPIHGNTRLEVFWTAASATVIVGLVTYGLIVLHHIEQPAHGRGPPEMPVDVVAQQFTWTFSYPGEMKDGRALTTTQLWLPTGRTVHFALHSKDVIHSFWVPNFGPKEDVVPGVTTRLRITPDRPGTYPIICSELCGLGHAVMRSSVHVVTPARFKTWLAQQTKPAAPVHGGQQLAAVGKQVFTGTGGCGACHTLADAGTTGAIGPNLDKGLKGKGAAFIRHAITDPGSLNVPGYPKGVMPSNFVRILTRQQLDGLVSYLARMAAR